jgi:hypothetical protein
MKRVIIIVVLLAWPLLVAGNDNEQNQSVTVLVGNQQLNVYGHWMSDQVCIELVGEEVYADDWRVHPIIGLDLSIAPTNREPATTSLGKLVDRLSEVYCQQALTIGSEAARLMAIESFKSEPLIAEVVEYANTIKLVTADGHERYITFPPLRTIHELKEQRTQEAQRVYTRLVQTLEEGELVIFVSGVLPKVEVWRDFHYEVIDEIEQARRESARITTENWEGTRINALTAEQVRNPLPAKMKRR